MEKGHKDWQMNKGANLLQKLSSWREDSIGQFSSIINSNCNFINRGINEMVEEICGLKAELAVVKNERSALIQTVNKLKKINDEIWNMNTKSQPLPQPEGNLDHDSQDANGIPENNCIKNNLRNHVNSEGKDDEMMEDHIEETDSDEHNKIASNDSDTTSEITNDLAEEAVDDPVESEKNGDEVGMQEREKDCADKAENSEKPLSNEKKFQCDVCGFTSSPKELKQHKNTVHNKEGSKKFMCESCTFTCKTSGGLKVHKEWRHTDDHKYECDLCPYKTTFIKEFRKHAKRVHKKN